MKFKLPITLLMIGIMSCNSAPITEEISESASELVSEVAEDMVKPERLLRHVVMFKFQDAATAEQIKVVEDAFHELPTKIAAIHDYEWGINNSPEGLNKGLTHCFLVTFASEADREIYLPHPAHLAFVEVLKPILDDVTVIDYWAK